MVQSIVLLAIYLFINSILNEFDFVHSTSEPFDSSACPAHAPQEDCLFCYLNFRTRNDTFLTTRRIYASTSNWFAVCNCIFNWLAVRRWCVKNSPYVIQFYYISAQMRRSLGQTNKQIAPDCHTGLCVHTQAKNNGKQQAMVRTDDFVVDLKWSKLISIWIRFSGIRCKRPIISSIRHGRSQYSTCARKPSAHVASGISSTVTVLRASAQEFKAI